MQATEQISLTLPAEMVARVRKWVSAGVYPDESAAVADAIDTMDVTDPLDGILPEITPAEVEHWLRTEVVPAAEALRRDPSLGLSMEQVRASLSLDRTMRDD